MKKPSIQWNNCVVGITGANGTLGKALIKKLCSKGAYVIGITHSNNLQSNNETEGPQEWFQWNCGEEKKLEKILFKIDILILNHGINPHGSQSSNDIDKALEVNALSTWRIMMMFEDIINKKANPKRKSELWINSSEAEIQPAFSPGYELSKRLIGQLVSIRWNNLNQEQRKNLNIRKLVLGPFKSELNPIGIMKSNFVADMIILQANLDFNLIIVSPNPITYISMPIVEIIRKIYFRTTKIYGI